MTWLTLQRSETKIFVILTPALCPQQHRLGQASRRGLRSRGTEGQVAPPSQRPAGAGLLHGGVRGAEDASRHLPHRAEGSAGHAAEGM